MRMNQIPTAMAVVTLGLTLSGPVRAGCDLLTNQGPMIKAEESRLKDLGKEVELSNYADRKKTCEYLVGHQKLNLTLASIFRKCAEITNVHTMDDTATTLEQEASQVYARSAMQYNCQPLSN